MTSVVSPVAEGNQALAAAAGCLVHTTPDVTSLCVTRLRVVAMFFVKTS